MLNKNCRCGKPSLLDDILCPTCKVRMTSVIVNIEGNAVYIPLKDWEERQKYRELKRKWEWLD